jgi:hypothetical protein
MLKPFSFQEYRREYRIAVMALRTHVALRTALMQVLFVPW